MIDDRNRCLNEGMNDYLAKPIELGPLENMLAKWLPISDMGEPEAAFEEFGRITRRAERPRDPRGRRDGPGSSRREPPRESGWRAPIQK